ncbi:MAG: hypothetical protein ABIO55_01050 [Ginsengibacter sp.]
MIRNIGRDKWKHFFVGIVMGMVLQSCGWFLFPNNTVLSTVAAFIVVVIISYGFELFSKYTGKGHYELNDAIASAIGGVSGMGILLMIQLNTSV